MATHGNASRTLAVPVAARLPAWRNPPPILRRCKGNPPSGLVWLVQGLHFGWPHPCTASGDLSGPARPLPCAAREDWRDTRDWLKLQVIQAVSSRRRSERSGEEIDPWRWFWKCFIHSSRINCQRNPLHRESRALLLTAGEDALAVEITGSCPLPARTTFRVATGGCFKRSLERAEAGGWEV
ncbi:hypothetical protein F4780DRAFT_397937 [Xylariomycetidae sp. FL0641]|nr:hypothetical protein F4780DRAFT_397937 [Xylariomycetidae sp. FL0641]